MNYLELINIEFMINSCLNSTFKIYKIKYEVDDGEINQLVNTHFSLEEEVAIDHFLQYCKRSYECE